MMESVVKWANPLVVRSIAIVELTCQSIIIANQKQNSRFLLPLAGMWLQGVKVQSTRKFLNTWKRLWFSQFFSCLRFFFPNALSRPLFLALFSYSVASEKGKVFFSIRVFFNRLLRFTGQQREWESDPHWIVSGLVFWVVSCCLFLSKVYFFVHIIDKK